MPIALWKHLPCSKAELCPCPSSNSSYLHFSDTAQLEEPFSSNHSSTLRTCKNPASFFLWTICNLHPSSFPAATQFLNLLLHPGFSNTTSLLSLPTQQTPESPLLQAPRSPSLSHHGASTSHWGRESAWHCCCPHKKRDEILLYACLFERAVNALGAQHSH